MLSGDRPIALAAAGVHELRELAYSSSWCSYMVDEDMGPEMSFQEVSQAWAEFCGSPVLKLFTVDMNPSAWLDLVESPRELFHAVALPAGKMPLLYRIVRGAPPQAVLKAMVDKPLETSAGQLQSTKQLRQGEFSAEESLEILRASFHANP